ncbi:hypothetical protein P4O66_014058 [Electrophorus voltai]|uniref:RHD domain-containing protein n=1 Tax=Electrophorus voltai TaxID=2609070 RepID=A0AAD8Z3Z8_9TELE|nr:hypothetical protein P4O66_014058 [Electrophorus voltai]
MPATDCVRFDSKANFKQPLEPRSGKQRGSVFCAAPEPSMKSADEDKRCGVTAQDASAPVPLREQRIGNLIHAPSQARRPEMGSGSHEPEFDFSFLFEYSGRGGETDAEREAFSYVPNVSLSTLTLGMGSPCLGSQYHNLQTSPVISVSSCHQASYGLHGDPMASGYYLPPGLRPPLESPRIEITTYTQIPEVEVEEESVDPLAKRVNIVTLTLPSADGYRDPSCLSPASSLSSRSCNSEASYESGFYNYDNSPQNSPWQSPCVSPKGSGPLHSCSHAPVSPSASPHVAAANGDGWARPPRDSRPGSPAGGHGKRKYGLDGGPCRPPLYSPSLSPSASPQGSPRLSCVDEAWLGTTNQYTNSAIVAAINALSTDGLADLGEGVPLKARKTNLEHGPAASMKAEPGADEMGPVSELCQEDYLGSGRLPFKKERYCGSFLDVPPHLCSWTKPKTYISPSLPALDWQLPSCSGPYSLQIEVQPKSHHRAHYETEGSRGAVKALSGGHPVVQSEVSPASGSGRAGAAMEKVTWEQRRGESSGRQLGPSRAVPPPRMLGFLLIKGPQGPADPRGSGAGLFSFRSHRLASCLGAVTEPSHPWGRFSAFLAPADCTTVRGISHNPPPPHSPNTPLSAEKGRRHTAAVLNIYTLVFRRNPGGNVEVCLQPKDPTFISVWLRLRHRREAPRAIMKIITRVFRFMSESARGAAMATSGRLDSVVIKATFKTTRPPGGGSEQAGHTKLKGKALYGYVDSEPLTLQLFIGTADDRLLRPHAFYQVHRITGKTVSTPSHEAMQTSTKVLEIPLLPENNMRAILRVSCVCPGSFVDMLQNVSPPPDSALISTPAHMELQRPHGCWGSWSGVSLLHSSVGNLPSTPQQKEKSIRPRLGYRLADVLFPSNYRCVGSDKTQANEPHPSPTPRETPPPPVDTPVWPVPDPQAGFLVFPAPALLFPVTKVPFVTRRAGAAGSLQGSLSQGRGVVLGWIRARVGPMSDVPPETRQHGQCSVVTKSFRHFRSTKLSVFPNQQPLGSDLPKLCPRCPLNRIDCAGILKLRNSDIELRKGETDIGRKNTRVRMVFRVHINQPNGRTVSLQVASNPIECSQRSAQELPLVEKQSMDTYPATGGKQMLLSGHNFLADSKVMFVEKAQDGHHVWETEAKVDKDSIKPTSLVVEIPPYRSQRIASAVPVSFYVCNSKRKRSQYQRFTYLPPSSKHPRHPCSLPAVPETLRVLANSRCEVPGGRSRPRHRACVPVTPPVLSCQPPALPAPTSTISSTPPPFTFPPSLAPSLPHSLTAPIASSFAVPMIKTEPADDYESQGAPRMRSNPYYGQQRLPPTMPLGEAEPCVVGSYVPCPPRPTPLPCSSPGSSPKLHDLSPVPFPGGAAPLPLPSSPDHTSLAMAHPQGSPHLGSPSYHPFYPGSSPSSSPASHPSTPGVAADSPYLPAYGSAQPRGSPPTLLSEDSSSPALAVTIKQEPQELDQMTLDDGRLPSHCCQKRTPLNLARVPRGPFRRTVLHSQAPTSSTRNRGEVSRMISSLGPARPRGLRSQLSTCSRSSAKPSCDATLGNR